MAFCLPVQLASEGLGLTAPQSRSLAFHNRFVFSPLEWVSSCRMGYWPGCESGRYAGAHGGGLLVGVEMMRPLLGSIHLNGFVLLSE